MLFSDLGYELTVCKYNKTVLALYKWEKGKSSPRTLTTIDYEELKKTEKIIARKFDIDVDTEIIERLRKR